MIYFDNNKQVYAFEISNPIATIDSDTWLKYAGTDKWDIIAGQFLDITDTPEYQQKEAQREQERKNQEYKQLLSETDWKVIRHRDQLALGLETSLTDEEYQELLQQRQTARDSVVEI